MDRNEGEAAFNAEIHQRLLAGDRVATSDLCEHYLLMLFRQLRSKWRDIDEDLVHQAIDDALFDYGSHPERFDPTRSSLNSYLFMMAHRDLSNAYHQDAHWRRNIVPLYPVENDDEPGNTELGRTEDFVDALLDQQMADELGADALAHCETEEERIVARLMLDGEKQTAIFAQALGVANLPAKQQQAVVFRIKDRITRRWIRGREDFHHV